MNLENISTSLELSKKLEPYLKGYESLFCWRRFDDGYSVELKIIGMINALTAEECLELLPMNLEEGSNYFLTMRKLYKEYSASYMADESYLQYVDGPTLTESLGNLLLCCYKEKIIR